MHSSCASQFVSCTAVVVSKGQSLTTVQENRVGSRIANMVQGCAAGSACIEPGVLYVDNVGLPISRARISSTSMGEIKAQLLTVPAAALQEQARFLEQGIRRVGVGRDLGRSSSLTLLLEQDHPE